MVEVGFVIFKSSGWTGLRLSILGMPCGVPVCEGECEVCGR